MHLPKLEQYDPKQKRALIRAAQQSAPNSDALRLFLAINTGAFALFFVVFLVAFWFMLSDVQAWKTTVVVAGLIFYIGSMIVVNMLTSRKREREEMSWLSIKLDIPSEVERILSCDGVLEAQKEEKIVSVQDFDDMYDQRVLSGESYWLATTHLNPDQQVKMHFLAQKTAQEAWKSKDLNLLHDLAIMMFFLVAMPSCVISILAGFLMFILGFAVWGMRIMRRRQYNRRAMVEVLLDQRVRPYCCALCGYDLRGSIRGQCPECGSHYFEIQETVLEEELIVS